MHNKTSIRFGFCDIQNNQCCGKGYQLKPNRLFWISQKPHSIIVYNDSVDLVLKYVVLKVVCCCKMYPWKILDMSVTLLHGC